MSCAQKQMWSEYILQHVCVPVYVMAEISIQACNVAYFLPSHCKFGSKWLLSCTFSNGGVTPYLFVRSHRGTWRVFKKVSLVFYIFNSSNGWTFCCGRKFLQVDRGFLYFQNTILLFMFFPFSENIIYTVHVVGKASNTVKMKNHHCMSAHAV